MVFKDLPTLRRWLQEYSVRCKRPFKVMHSYMERRYTVVCEMADCNSLIPRKLYTILKGQPNLKVRTIMQMIKEIFKYDIKYGKAWRAKQRAWKMIYGDWEKGYEQLPAMFNAMKAANPGMHYEYIPKPNEWNDGR
jgi:hypothetical protein